jgi:hypothetical protein
MASKWNRQRGPRTLIMKSKRLIIEPWRFCRCKMRGLLVGWGAADLPISEHIQHGAKLGALSQEAGSMTVHSIQQPRQDVTPHTGYTVKAPNFDRVFMENIYYSIILLGEPPSDISTRHVKSKYHVLQKKCMASLT